MEKDGKILLAQRKNGVHLGGKWEFPGGKVNAGETDQAALKREMEEEFGITISVGRLVLAVTHSYDKKNIALFTYRAVQTGGFFSVRDHQAIAWVPPSSLLRYDLAAADRPAANLLAGMIFSD